VKYVPSWFPGASFKKIAAEWRANLTEMTELPHRMVKEQIANGTAAPSFSQELLESKPASAFSTEEEETIKWTAASLYSGGADTTVSAISTFFLAMAMNPKVVKKAQAELDRVVGGDRLPAFKDRANLPYVEAVCKEVLRYVLHASRSITR
jgi:cytochrome P450